MNEAARDTIRKTYASARTTHETVERLFRVLSTELGLQPQQVMHADSICCDDLNEIEYPERAHEMLGPFKLGGLAGFPFAGLTGMGAFAHHVPEEGAVFVFYAPHIGITKLGEVGATLRPGQTKPSSCCGAARAALAKLESGSVAEGVAADELDYQQNAIEQMLVREKERILGASNRIVEAAEVIYEFIERRVDLLASRTQYPCKHLVLMGGILINGDHDVGSFSEVRRLVHVDLENGERTDWASNLEQA